MTGTAEPSGSPTRSCSASRGRCAPPGSRSPRTAPTGSSLRSRWSGSTTRGRRTSPAGRRCAPGPTTWPATTRCTRRTSTRRDGLPRPRPADGRAPRVAGLPPGRGRRRRRRSTADDGGPGDGQRDRGAAAPRRGLDVGGGEGAAGRDVRDPAAAPAARRTSRHQPWHRGTVDASRTLRASLRRMGEPGDIAWRRRGSRPRRVVLLVDVSGSMSGYADALLRLAHRFTQALPARAASWRRSRSAPGSPTSPGRCAAATPSERWSRPARPCRTGRAAPGWARRCGSSWTAGASAGWPAARWSWCSATAGSAATRRCWPSRWPGCKRIAHRVVWVNPHRGKAGYEPVQQGVIAVLPYVDDFVAGHSLATYAELVEVVARA